jgi:HEAT repeat protein
MRRIALLVLLSLPAAAAPAASEDKLKQTVDTYLSSIDVPISDARWTALGPQAAPLLASIAEGDVLPSRRAKALHALSLVDAARAAPLAVADVANPAQPLVVRSAAARAVARTLPAAEAVRVLRPVLSSATPPLQRRAAEALVSVGPEGCTALQAHTARLDAEARTPFSPALAHCPGATPP